MGDEMVEDEGGDDDGCVGPSRAFVKLDTTDGGGRGSGGGIEGIGLAGIDPEPDRDTDPDEEADPDPVLETDPCIRICLLFEC